MNNMRNLARTLMFVNGLFFFLNAGFMYIVSVPVINLVCALFSLLGFLAAYSMYQQNK